nr:MBL fold metallo-hydrolase [uncultured Rothia sp.]
MRITVDRYHYPVGQGIFSAQVIKGLGDSKYVCVYDCGSVSGADEMHICVNNLYEKLNTNGKDGAKIDLLVISHLDKDHVNGVSELIKLFDIKKIVIPYMSKIEKIMLALDSPAGRRMLERRDHLTPRSSLINAINRAGDENIQYLEEKLRDAEIVESSRDISTEYFDMNEDTSKVKYWPYKLWEFLHFSLYAGEEESVKDGFVEEFKNSYRLEFGRNCKDLNKMTASDLSNDWIKLKKVYAKTCERMEEAQGVNCKDIFNSSSVILYSGPADNLTGSGENHCRVHRVSKGRQIIVDYKNLDEHYRESFYYRIENDNSNILGVG